VRPPERPTGARGFAFGLSLLILRGILLWVVIPVATIAWLVLWPFLRAKKVRLGQLIGWSDLNLVAALEHSILRPLALAPYPWTPWRELPNVTHRVGVADPA